MGLTEHQVLKRVSLLKENLELLHQEEDYCRASCHEEWLLKGDNNTKYFHRIVNGRRRRNRVISLEHEGLVIEGDENLLNHATAYYSELFGSSEEHDIHINDSIWAECEQVSAEDNIWLCNPFSENEIKNALFQMEKNKGAGPDKIPIEFYQTCWDIVKNDVIQLFDDFYNNKVDISRLNYGIITLLPKVNDANRIQ